MTENQKIRIVSTVTADAYARSYKGEGQIVVPLSIPDHPAITDWYATFRDKSVRKQDKDGNWVEGPLLTLFRGLGWTPERGGCNEWAEENLVAGSQVTVVLQYDEGFGWQIQWIEPALERDDLNSLFKF